MTRLHVYWRLGSAILAVTGVEDEVRAAVAVDTSFASDQVRSSVVGSMAVVCAPHTGAKATGTGGFIVRFITPCQSFSLEIRYLVCDRR